MEPTVFQFIGGTIENATDAFLSPVIGLVVGILSGVVAIGVILYVLVVGMLIVLGYVQQPVSHFAGKSIRIVIVTSIALSVEAYGAYVVSVIDGLEVMFAQALNVSGTTSASIYQTLDQSFGAGLDLVARCFEAADNASWRQFGSIIGWTAAGLIIAVGSVFVALIGGAVIIVAKFALAMMIAVGPLFVVCLVWPVTAKYFEGWVGQVVNFTLVVAFIALVMAFSAVAFTGFVAEADLEGGTSPIIVACEVFVLACILGFIAYQAQSWAASLSGGMSMAILSLRHMTAPLSAIKNAASSARDIVNPRTTRRDLESGHMVTARRSSQLLAGNTYANPAYRQHLRERIGKNWSRARGGQAKR